MSTETETEQTETEQTETEQTETEQTVLVAKERAKVSREKKDIHLTEASANKVKEIMKAEDHPDTMYLYVGVKGGGCAGLSFVLDLREEGGMPIKDTDEVFESNGIIIVSDLKSYVVGNMSGTTIDYQDGLMGAGFVFSNPNAKTTCGCGSSYSPG